MQVRNSITLIGNLGSTPKVITTDAGLTITEFSLATNEYFRDKDGNRQTRTDWHKVKAFGKLAEIFGKYLNQGSQVAIAGSLRYNKWTDKHDQVRNTAEVVAHSFTFLSGGKQQEAEDELAADTVAEVAPAKNRGKKKAATVAEDVVPF
ncbi:MAG: single-strand DNA-binding protein [Neolewinella sp.]|jgi:single-strand DNA-binding protein